MTMITIIVTPIASSPGRFTAKLANEGDVLVRSSRTPFLDAARRLLELGYPVDAVLVMRHARSAVESLCAKIGKAAALTVTTAGSGRPIFVARSVAAALPVRSINESRHILAPRTEIRTGEAAATDSPPIAPYDSPEVTEPPTQHQCTDELEGASLAESTADLMQTCKERMTDMIDTAIRKHVARKLVENDSTLLTLEKLDSLIERIEEAAVEQWLSTRKEAGLQIDPETAEVDWIYAQTGDPYNVRPELPEEHQQVGREYFARSPGSKVWVCFRDLPEEVGHALWEKHKSRLAFPAGHPTFGRLRDEGT
jgi:hypothetical protein